MILRAFYTLKINSLEELAKTPLDKIKKYKGIGEKSIEIIQSLLEKNGFTPTNRAVL
jgi:DNA uptake protein ComE-like DNA-binding protein